MQTLVVVSGLPGSGKTTLAAALAKHLQVEHLDKDRLLEAMFREGIKITPQHRYELSRRADDELKTQALLLRSAVLSSWWRHPKTVQKSGTPVDWLMEDGVKFVEVFCQCPAAVAAHRFESRQRHPGHLDTHRARDDLLEQFVAAERLGPLFPETAIVCGTVAPMSPLTISALATQVKALAGAANEA